MDKGRRQELKMQKYRQRIRKIRPLALAGEDAYYAYRSHSTPCSCWCCRPKKYNRAQERKNAIRISADVVSEAICWTTSFLRNEPFITEIEGCD